NHHAKTIELCFRQRKHALLLDGILRREYPEWIFQTVGCFTDRDLPFLHRLEQSTLRLLRRAVDFVGENDVCEDRALFGSEFAGLAVENSRAENVGRKHIRRELDALEFR